MVKAIFCLALIISHDAIMKARSHHSRMVRAASEAAHNPTLERGELLHELKVAVNRGHSLLQDVKCFLFFIFFKKRLNCEG